jgi:hypothetical protein
VIAVVIESVVDATLATRALETALDGLRRGGDHASSHQQSRFFQGRDDPSRFVYLGIWDSRGAYERAFDARQRSAIEAALAQPVEPRYFRSLVTYERILVPIEALACQIVEGPPGAEAPLRAYFQELFERRRTASTGAVLSLLGQELDRPGNFIVLTGWRSWDALAAVSSALGDEFSTRVAAVGATYRRFLGQTRFDSTQMPTERQS